MKCKRCQDEGKLYMPGKFIKCPDCQSVTNAEYMRQCDDASLAFEIWNLIKDGNIDSLYHIERWLKEKHE